VTYAGAYGGNERVPVDRGLRREGHPLGVRRAEATKVATEEAEESQASNKRWTFGVAAGALLVAGTFAAGALGLTHSAAPTSAPEHANASGQGPNSPVVGAPVPGQDNNQQQQQQQPQIPQQGQSTTPASAGAPSNAPANTNAGTNSGTSADQSGATSQSSSAADTSTTAPAPSTTTPAPTEEQDGGLVGDVTDTVGDVLSPVTDVVGGVLSPQSSTTTTTTPSGPALTMINPLADLLG